MPFTPQQRWLFVARAAVSAIILAAGLLIILSGAYSDTTSEWAAGMIGLVIGYWLR